MSAPLSSDPSPVGPGRGRARAAVLLLALAVWVPLGGSSWAQAPTPGPAEEKAAGEPAPPAPAPIQAIATADVAREAERAKRTLSALQRVADESEAINRVAEALPGLARDLDALRARTAQSLESAPLATLDDLRSDWSAASADLPDWRRTLRARVAEVEEALASLATLDEVWRKTRERSEREGDPSAVQAQVRDLLARIAATRTRVLERRTSLLTLQAAVSAEESRVESAISDIVERRQLLVSRVLERDALPLWSPELRSRVQLGDESATAAALGEQVDELRRFVVEERTRLGLHALAGLVAIAFLFAARTRVRRRTEEETGLRRVAEVFEFPIAVGLLLTLLATPSFYPYVPELMSQLLGAAALVPAVRLLRVFLAPPLYPLLNALVAFYLLDRVREAASALPLFSRAVFLVEMLGGVILLAWLLRPARLTGIPRESMRDATLRWLGLSGRLALLAFGVSFVAESAGFSRLGRLLGGATLESAYVGVIGFAVVRILDSLTTFALRVRPLGRLGMVQRSRATMIRRSHRVVVLAALGLWAVITLELLALRRPIFEAATAALTAEAQVGSLRFSASDVIAFAFTIWLAFLVSRFLRFVLESDVYPRVRLARGVPYAVSTLSHYTVLLLGFFLAVAATGIDLNRFALLAGAFGVGIGFGLQNVVNNFVSGLILLTERPVQVGDTIEAGDALGEVKRIGIRSSTVRTWSGAELIVPNSQLISERVINWTLSDRQRRIDVPVGVAYGTPRQKVLDLLLEVARANQSVLDEPPPLALFTGFGDSSLDFELRAWTDRIESFIRVRSELSVEISDALDAAGIEIPFPQRDLHLRSVAPEAGRRMASPGSEGRE